MDYVYQRDLLLELSRCVDELWWTIHDVDLYIASREYQEDDVRPAGLNFGVMALDRV